MIAMEDNAAIAEKMATAWRFLYDKGFIDGFGHISARTADPERILMTPHSLGRSVRSEDFVLVDLNGQQFGTTAPMPSEFPIHTEIYKVRPDVGSVAHFHCLYPTSFGMSDRELRPTYFLASIFRSGVPIHPDSRLINSADRGSALAKTLAHHRAAIMKGHGIVIAAADVMEMMAATYILEDNAHRTWISATMGNVEYLTDAAMAEIEAEIYRSKGPFRRIWSMCEAHSKETLRAERAFGQCQCDQTASNMPRCE
jgi:ribulose-5-phosphate 4-epimerase/fuculose-1-phosphate aldolase